MLGMQFTACVLTSGIAKDGPGQAHAHPLLMSGVPNYKWLICTLTHWDSIRQTLY